MNAEERDKIRQAAIAYADAHSALAWAEVNVTKAKEARDKAVGVTQDKYRALDILLGLK